MKLENSFDVKIWVSEFNLKYIKCDKLYINNNINDHNTNGNKRDLILLKIFLDIISKFRFELKNKIPLIRPKVGVGISLNNKVFEYM